MTSCGRFVVVIPAHNEQDTLDECLRSVTCAAHAVTGASVDVVLVLDDCNDGSAEIARRHQTVDVVTIRASSVGAARAAGAAHALIGRTATDLAHTWLATTDADSVVQPSWLLLHQRIALAGADALIGAVVPRLEELDPLRAARWSASHPPGATLGHVHGANLGVRASAYRAAGGFLPAAADEDVDLVRALRAAGAHIAQAEDAPVITSARLKGRTPHGYADYLAALA
ncbi:MAG TPA: glycosyltransferase [Humibacter sp.]|nr:glycosyltransferase [Humibacter sp.]